MVDTEWGALAKLTDTAAAGPDVPMRRHGATPDGLFHRAFIFPAGSVGHGWSCWGAFPLGGFPPSMSTITRISSMESG